MCRTKAREPAPRQRRARHTRECAPRGPRRGTRPHSERAGGRPPTTTRKPTGEKAQRRGQQPRGCFHGRGGREAPGRAATSLADHTRLGGPAQAWTVLREAELGRCCERGRKRKSPPRSRGCEMAQSRAGQAQPQRPAGACSSQRWAGRAGGPTKGPAVILFSLAQWGWGQGQRGLLRKRHSGGSVGDGQESGQNGRGCLGIRDSGRSHGGPR